MRGSANAPALALCVPLIPREFPPMRVCICGVGSVLKKVYCLWMECLLRNIHDNAHAQDAQARTSFSLWPLHISRACSSLYVCLSDLWVSLPWTLCDIIISVEPSQMSNFSGVSRLSSSTRARPSIFMEFTLSLSPILCLSEKNIIPARHTGSTC
eukprot:825968-Rhodomonas_salina.1